MLISSPEKMLKFGESLVKEHNVLLLTGELGAGKTLLTKGFVKGLGIGCNIVQSPTYAYLNVYENKVLHIDMYRIEKYEDLIEKGIIDQIQYFDYIVIERPKFIDKLGLKKFVKINIIKKSESEREIIITNI